MNSRVIRRLDKGLTVNSTVSVSSPNKTCYRRRVRLSPQSKSAAPEAQARGGREPLQAGGSWWRYTMVTLCRTMARREASERPCVGDGNFLRHFIISSS
eukprot:8274356-Pyramimonas_sp.AAC.1